MDNIKAKLLLEGITLESIPDYGDRMTLAEFVSTCMCGGFIDSDGFGNYAFANECTSLEIYPSHVHKNKIDQRFTHVVWFNK